MKSGSESLFLRLRDSNRMDWETYVGHPFLLQLAQGTLPEPAFRHYLGQDYLFLVHFARAYGLAVYKSAHLDDMRQASQSLSAILDVEIGLHVKYCAEWGVDESDLQALSEDPATIAYTRYVLEVGLSGDVLDLHTALAPCMIGYAEIGRCLAADPATVHDGNPYKAWIDMYAGDEYQEIAASQADTLDRLYAVRGGPGRMPELVKIFGEATRLEAAFWQMGLDAAK